MRRQTRESRFSYYDGSWEQLEALVADHWSERKPGYRDGVVLVPVPVEGFYSAVVETEPGDQFTTIMEARREVDVLSWLKPRDSSIRMLRFRTL